MNTTGEIMRAAKMEQGITIDEFRAALRRGMVSNLSHGKVHYWLTGKITPSYEEMYYLYSHAPEQWVQTMAMQVLDTLAANLAADQEPVITGPVSVATDKLESMEDANSITT